MNRVILEGSGEFIVPPGLQNIYKILLVGGGGSGGGGNGGGGGGAGEVRIYENVAVNPGESLSYAVGDGGLATEKNHGYETYFSLYSAIGGGAGGWGGQSSSGANGGSGGGSTRNANYGNGSSFGFRGGSSANSGGYGNGGGGGAGGAGGDGTETVNGAGGIGIYIGDVFGTDIGENGWVGGGGGAGRCDDPPLLHDTAGGNGGGGAGGTNASCTAGLAGTGGGGGGGRTAGANGGSGLIVIIYEVRNFFEHAVSLRISFCNETFRSFQLAPAARAEAWRGIQVRRAAPAEKAYEIYIDAAARLEKAAQLSVIATMGFEAFAALSVNGSLAAFEQFSSLSIEARERMVFETYQRLAVLGAVDSSIFEQSVGLIIDNSVVDFVSFAEQGGLYYRQFDVQVNVNPDTFPPRNVQLIRSLPLYASASLVVQSTLLLESGPITQVDRIITLMYDGVQEETRAADQQTGAESVTATLRLVSPTAGLGYLNGDSGSQRFSKSWAGGTMASEIMDELFAGSGLSYDLRIDDFPIGQQLTVDNKFPFEIWPLLFIKERIRTGDDGDTLIIAPVLPCLPAALPTQPLDHDLDPGQYMVQSTIADDGGQVRYNMIRVASYQDADASAMELAAPELGEINSSGYREIFGWPVPWRKIWLRGCHLPHDGYELRAEGVVEELELEETISFDNGIGRTQRPIYALLSVDWSGNASLGAVTPGEDGTLTAATAGKSVAVVRYRTRRYKFLYREAEGDHKMSMWLTDEES